MLILEAANGGDGLVENGHITRVALVELTHDQVVQCGERDCLALPLCTVSAGVQCVTGLGL